MPQVQSLLLAVPAAIVNTTSPPGFKQDADALLRLFRIDRKAPQIFCLSPQATAEVAGTPWYFPPERGAGDYLNNGGGQ